MITISHPGKIHILKSWIVTLNNLPNKRFIWSGKNMNEATNNAVEESEEPPTKKPKNIVIKNNTIRINSFVLLNLKNSFQPICYTLILTVI